MSEPSATSSHRALARRWRPHQFAEVAGQRHVVRVLTHALSENRLHHAYLFTGTRGVGKTTLARLFAKAINCEQGIGPQPCGVCATCQALDTGRFVDLVEVDAASRTGVDDTRELLENVPYAPSQGRFKVYLIDEVHMFSKSSFNALLKTLEEPPGHVKFLLATTDPQKIPVTVLSRCLQLNLKALPSAEITTHLTHIAEREGLACEPEALGALAEAARGSLRDALTLLEQAIAFGGGTVRRAEVDDLVGNLPQGIQDGFLEALIQGDAPRLLGQVAMLEAHGADFDGALSSLLSALHRMALYQWAPEQLADQPGITETTVRLASEASPEALQLYYQMGLQARADLAWAPEPRQALEMALIRMLAFRPLATGDTPDAGAGSAASLTAPSGAEAATPNRSAHPAPTPPARASSPAPHAAAPRDAERRAEAPSSATPSADPWRAFLEAGHLRGLATEVARHCELAERREGEIAIRLAPSHQHLLTDGLRGQINEAVKRHFGVTRLSIEVADPRRATPAETDRQQAEDRLTSARQAMAADPLVQRIQERFDATEEPGSLDPTDPG